jgi:SAUR family protein
LEALIMGVRGSKLSELIGSRGGGRVKRPAPAPRGYVPVSVGVNNDTCRRFMVHTTTLTDADFLELLCRSAEEYGFCNEGVLRIPYEAKDFEERMMRRSNRKVFMVN